MYNFLCCFHFCERRNQPCALTRAQARYLLHTLTEAAQILNAELQHRSPEERVTDAVTTQRRIFNLYLRTVRYFPIVTIVLQVCIDAWLGNCDNGSALVVEMCYIDTNMQ